MRTLLLSMALLPALSAVAQQPAQQPAPPQGSNWQHVQALPIGSSINVKARTTHLGCTLKSVDADSLTCTHRKDVTFQRSDVLNIRITHRVRSTLVAAALGGGVGAVIGAASIGGCSQQQRQSFLGCFQIVSRADGAALIGGVGAIVAAPIGYSTDFTHSTVYKAP
jgi:hypothetical protein